MYSCDAAVFSASLLQCHMIFRNHNNMLLKKHLLLKTAEYNFFRFLWRSEEYNWSEIEIFCSFINVFIITFDQFKASLLNKSINFYTPPHPKMILTPCFWMVWCIMLQNPFISHKCWCFIHQIIQKNYIIWLYIIYTYTHNNMRRCNRLYN